MLAFKEKKTFITVSILTLTVLILTLTDYFFFFGNTNLTQPEISGCQ